MNKKIAKRLIYIGFIIVLSVFIQGCSNRNAADKYILQTTEPTSFLIQTTLTQNTMTQTPNPTSNYDANIISQKDLEISEEWFQKGAKLYSQGQYKQAITNLDKSIQANKNNYKAYTTKGIALCFLGDYVNGIIFIQKALDIKPDYVSANYNMAMGYKLQKDYDNALIWFEKTIKLDPKSTWSYYGISTIYADRNITEKAIEYLRKAIELDASVKETARIQSHFDGLRKNKDFAELVK